MNYLGIDYGRAHVGVAFAATSLAEPIKTIPVAEAVEYIVGVVKEKEVDKIVVGLPSGVLVPEVTAFGEKLAQMTGLPVVYADEELTSQDAKQALRHTKKAVRSGPDHHFAAALILEHYLETQAL